MTATAKPTPAQAAMIAYFHDGTRSSVRSNQASYTVCEREGWVEKTESFPYHRATDAGIRAIGREVPVHLHTGFGVDGKAVCGEKVTEQTKTATNIDKVTHAGCRAAYDAYREKLTAELRKFARREAPYDGEPQAAPAGDTRRAGTDADDEAAVVEHVEPPAVVRDVDGREFGVGALVVAVAEGDGLRGDRATVIGVTRTAPDPTVVLRFEHLSNPHVRYADEVRVVDETVPCHYARDTREGETACGEAVCTLTGRVASERAGVTCRDCLDVLDTARLMRAGLSREEAEDRVRRNREAEEIEQAEADDIDAAEADDAVYRDKFDDTAEAADETESSPAEEPPTVVRVDGRDVVLADATLVQLAVICRDEMARAQHLNPNEGRRYFRARRASDAALDEIKRRMDTLHRAAVVTGPDSGLADVLAVLDATDRRAGDQPPAAPTT
ncbi:hypothetical protein ABZ671_01175 [Micromonospora sp. NPDC006766]|uniref:hypothetical protein n=1 Tax=Micromonospora sp. NPDC006766 TaxID=3154778 RepID=UPI0033C5DBB2